ncbi:MAG: OmpA family protein [Bacteroidales bacterium]|nr:OmpA family protein [Bacteroidales bacterium]
MKGIKIFFGALAAAGLLLSVSATAQENANRDADGNVVRGPYETNGFWDNTFIGAGIGANSGLNAGNYGDVRLFVVPGLALDLYAGKWFTPAVGARVGYYGLTNQGFDAMQHNLSLDLLWDITTTIDGYKETRVWSWIPYFRAGFHAYDGHIWAANRTWALGGGLIAKWHPSWLGERWNIIFDGRGIFVPDKELDGPSNTPGDGHGWNGRNPNTGQYDAKLGFISMPVALTVGVSYHFNKTGFDRHNSVTPTIIPVPFTLEEYNALEQKVADLEKENAELKDKIAALEEENEKYRNLANGQTYEYVDGEFVASDSAKGAPGVFYFDCGKATLSERELAHLEFFAQSVLDSGSSVVVTGSADKQTGTARVNQKLSEQRADYVKNILVKKYGLSEDNIEVVAEGDKNNVFDTPAKNRCVTIRVK